MENDRIKPREELENVLEQISNKLDFKNAHLELSSDDKLYALITFLREHFYPDETLNKSLGLSIDDNIIEMTAIWEYRLKEHLSLILMSDVSGEIIGTMTMKTIKNIPDQKAPTLAKESKRNKIMKFLYENVPDMNVFKRYCVDTAIGFIAVAVHKNHRNQGLASRLMQASLMFCKEIGLNPCCVSGEGTSNYSQRLYEKFGFEVLRSAKYSDYVAEGELMFKNTGDNESIKFYVKKNFEIVTL